MPAEDYKTVSDELIHVADAARVWLENAGYTVEIENKRIGFPFVPTFVATRGHETQIIEVVSTIDQRHLDRWVRYCRSQTVDTRTTIFLRSTSGVDGKSMRYVVANGLGLQVHDDEMLVEVRGASDLAVHVDLPDLADLPPPVRAILGPSFQKFSSNDWRDGLFEAYNQVEQKARDYLAEGVASGSIVTFRKVKKNLVQITTQDVQGMTLGALKHAYANIQNQTHKDSIIATTLDMINETRNGLAHRRSAAAVERKVRAEAGNHVYAAITCLEELTT